MELNGSINLSDSQNFQAVYGTQIYGTLYGLFARFTATKVGATYNVSKIEFYEANYKGILNIGIVEISTPEVMTITDSDDNVLYHSLYCKIKVKAMHETQESALIKDNLNLTIPSTGAFFDIDRRVEPMYEPVGDFLSNNRKVFDTEFYYREGPFSHKEREVRPIRYDEPFDFFENVNAGVPHFGPPHSGLICPSGRSMIF